MQHSNTNSQTIDCIKHPDSSFSDKKTPQMSYTAPSKQLYSYNELLFISVEVNSLMVKADNKTEHQKTEHKLAHVDQIHKSHTRTSQTTSENLSTRLSNKTFCDITQF